LRESGLFNEHSLPPHLLLLSGFQTSAGFLAARVAGVSSVQNGCQLAQEVEDEEGGSYANFLIAL